MLSQDEQWLLKEKYGGEKTEGFFTACERLKTGEPLGYVIGWTPFLDCKIHLDSTPLIPRPETEFWTEKAILETEKHLTDLENERPAAGGFGWGDSGEKESSLSGASKVKILDLCAGSGAIGVAVAKSVPKALVDFGEIDARHLPTITKNLSENGIDHTRYRIWKSDLFENISEKFDFILTNPPYIDPALDRTQPSVKDFEPHLALYGGQDGMELIAKIISESPEYLKPNGQLWIEHEPEQSQAIKELGQQNNFQVTTHKDQYYIERYTVLVLQ